MSISRRSFVAATAVLGALPGATFANSTNPESEPEVSMPGRTPHTKFAVNIEMWFRGPLHERVAAVAELGFPAIEFWPHENKDISQLGELLRQHEMTATQFTAWGFGRELNHPALAAERFLSAIETSCAVADELPGCDLFTVVLGDNIDGFSKAEMHAAAIGKIIQAVPILEKHGKTMIIEPMNPYNHPGHCLYGSADGIAICQAIGSEHVKLNWDLFHMQRFEGNLIDNMRTGKDYIGYLQFADSPGRFEPGTGEVNFTNVLQAIHEIGYNRPVGLECLPQGGDTRRAAARVHAADTW